MHCTRHFVVEEVGLFLCSHESLSQVLNVLSLDLKIGLLHLHLFVSNTLVEVLFAHSWLLAFVHHLRLVCNHLSLSVSVLLLRGELFDLISQLSAHHDQLDVILHDVHVVLSMSFSFSCKSLLQGVL